MYNFDMTPFAEMIKRDEQLLIALNEWDGKTSSLYKDNLPAFEKFLFELPESLTLNDVEHELSFQPVGLRLLFAARLMEFSQRIEDSGTLPTYRNLRQFLFHELYENHPEKISWKYSH